MNSDYVVDKVRGAFVGLALGDALGLPFETMTPEKILEVTSGKGISDFDHGVVRKTKEGKEIRNLSVSDDTQMSCCVAESLIKCEKFDLLDQALSHVKQLEFCTDGWGSAHRNGLSQIKSYFDSRGTEGRSCFVPAPFEKQKGAGNGVAMKIFPLILMQNLKLCYNDCYDHYKHEKEIAQLAGLTHGDRRAWGAAISLYHLLYDIIKLNKIFGISSISRIIYSTKYFENKFRTNRQKRFSSFLDKVTMQDLTDPILDVAKKLGTNCVSTESVVFAIVCILRNPFDFEKALLEAINSGGDTDTIASIVGAFVGYNVGYSNIPEKWQKILPQTDYLLDLSGRFYDKFAK